MKIKVMHRSSSASARHIKDIFMGFYESENFNFYARSGRGVERDDLESIRCRFYEPRNIVVQV